MRIISLDGLEILDSRGNPTVQVEVVLDDGSKGVFTVPSGASTGIHEAHELRDKDNEFLGKGVKSAVSNVLSLRESLVNKDFTQESLDVLLNEIDGTENKEKLGANCILGVSVAFSKACAKSYNLPLNEYLYRLVNGIDFEEQGSSEFEPINLFSNVINGGLHSGNALNIQEFMILTNVGSQRENVRATAEIYQVLKGLIASEYGKDSTAVGDEGGFAPNISKAEDALDLLTKAVKEAGYEGKVCFALDAAASDFMTEDNKYEVETGLKLGIEELCDYYNNLISKYPLISIEDPYGEDDFEGWKYFMDNISDLSFDNFLTGDKKVLVVGDDLLVTNVKRMEMSIEKGLCNSLLLKINQIGTLTESIQAHLLAKSQGWHTIVSHRSGETQDDFISDLATAMQNSIKLGAPCRGERVAKYNRLLNIYN